MLSASRSRLACWSLRWSCFSPWLEEQPVRNRFTMDLAAFLVSVGDAKTLADPLARLFSEDALVRRLADHARGRPIGQFPRTQGPRGQAQRIRTEGRRSLDLLGRPEP